MAVITVHNYCPYIQMAGKWHMVVPSDMLTGKLDRVPILYLLSPEGEDGSGWLWHAQAELLAEHYGMAMVLVPCLQGCYTDMAFGYRFFQSLQHGVAEYLHRIFPALPLIDGQCYVAGPSMGGMGAVKLALTQPKRFAAAAAFSGRLDNEWTFMHPEENGWLTKKRMVNLWGSPEAIPGSENDLFFLLDSAQKSNAALPAFYISSGLEDSGAASSRRFAADARVQATYVERQGKQRWPHWANELTMFLAWLEQEGRIGRVAD